VLRREERGCSALVPDQLSLARDTRVSREAMNALVNRRFQGHWCTAIDQ
jgi:hypothetical protein